MRILGLDFGAKRIGVAISDPLGLTAQGIAVISKGAAFQDDIREINKIIEQYEGVTEIVVGLPKTMKGEIGPQAQKVLEFIGALKENIGLSITPWDERLTTVEAERTLIAAGLSRQKRKKVIDRSAAAYILQSYLESKRND
ncbi:Holliday junction resolvase RuvX [Candidatus Margulisiibacteriota bacterium]